MQIDPLLATQSGVINRRQLADAGICDSDIARMVRRRELVRIHRGVFLEHTGHPTWLQRAWAAVLSVEPAALSGESALFVAEGRRARRAPPRITVAVPWERRVTAPAGVDLVRVRGFPSALNPGTGVPRLRYERAAWDVAAVLHDRLRLVAHLADCVQSRCTSLPRLRDSLAARHAFPDRQWVLGVLDDLERGTCSVLEHGYLVNVERPHCLPTAVRQARVADEMVRYRDALYAGHGVAVEMDGRLFHDDARQRDADFDRDLAAAVSATSTVRISWGQVFERPCWTALQVARLLRARGWTGTPGACGPACATALAGSPAGTR